MIDSLIFVEIFINILLLERRSACPKNIPIVLIRLHEAMAFQNDSHKFGF